VESITQLSWLEALEQDTPEPDTQPESYFEKLLQLLQIRDGVPGWPDVFGSALKAWVNKTLHSPIRTLSLFSGGGGLDIAFHDAGFSVTQMVELEATFVETLALNAQNGRRLQGTQPLCIDIKDFDPPADFAIDFIIGGPPCQTFSAAGRRAAGVSGFDDPRGMLFQEYVRILKKLKPKGFLFENVYGIVGAQDGKPWKEIVRAFASAGYTISHRILDAADYGVPQHRERLIIVGIRDGRFAFPRPTHGPDSFDHRPYYTAGMAVEGIDEQKPGPVGGRYGHLLRNVPPGLNYSFYTEEMGHPRPVFSWRSKFSDLLYKADPTMPVRTIKAQGGQYTGPFHWENRSFSLGELKRLQTFPDEYVLAGGRQVAIEQIGNSVPPQFGRILAVSILSQLFGIHFPFDIETLAPGEALGFRRRKTALTAHYRRKAKEAIAQQSASGLPGSGEAEEDGAALAGAPSALLAYLGPNFTWVVQDERGQDYRWNVAFSVTQREQVIELLVRNPEDDPARTPDAVIEVHPARDWIIPAKQVRLSLQSASPHLFIAAWKAFEHYLASEGIKADLVQLNGYYQYRPAIGMKLARLEHARVDPDAARRWLAVHHVLEGNGVRQIIQLEHLAALWDLPLEQTVDALLHLRSLGYEVRSEYTNNQIPAGHVLIPYAFPTLNPLSVQLRKTLFPDAALEHLLPTNGENP
jgi:DNA (cytosine-5)-methyltransferase 1